MQTTCCTVAKAAVRSNNVSNARFPLSTAHKMSVVQPVLSGQLSLLNGERGIYGSFDTILTSCHSCRMTRHFNRVSTVLILAYQHVDGTPQLVRSRAFNLNFLLPECIMFILQHVPVLLMLGFTHSRNDKQFASPYDNQHQTMDPMDSV